MPIGKITTGVITDSAVTEAKLGAGTSSGTAVTQWHVDNLTFNSNQLSTSGTQDLILFPDTAQVGINTSSPSATLDVNGTLQAGSMKIDNTTLSTVNTNENLVISPNGSGNVEVTSVLQVDTITSNDSSALSFNTPIHVNTMSSVDSTAIQLNDGLNVSGAVTVNNDMFVTGNGVFTGSVQGKGFTEDMNALTSSSTITVNCDLARVHTVTLDTNTEFNITNLPTGGTCTIIITQDGAGSKTATFGTDGSSAVKFPSGSSVLSTGANDIDVVSVFNDGTNFLGNIARNYS